MTEQVRRALAPRRAVGRPSAVGRRRTAFTMVEMVMGVIIAAMIMMVVFRFLSGTRLSVMYGQVSLSNLEGARQVISYLRRDFAAACPMIAPNTDASEQYPAKEMLRRTIYNNVRPSPLVLAYSQPIEIDARHLRFFRFLFDPNSNQNLPRVEQVAYEFDPLARTLRRTIGNNAQSKTFSGIEDFQFRLYLHAVATSVPILWVNIVVLETYDGKKEFFGGKRVGEPLELSTSITSQFANSNLPFPSWNFRTYHTP